jgi:hypothetical protein
MRVVFQDNFLETPREGVSLPVSCLEGMAENLRRKLSNKSRFREAFDMLKRIVYYRTQGASEEESRAEIGRLINEFREAFNAEGSLLHYFDSFWEHKKGGSS